MEDRPALWSHKLWGWKAVSLMSRCCRDCREVWALCHHTPPRPHGEIKFTPAVIQPDISRGSSAGNFYPVILQFLLIHSRTLPTHTSLRLQMSLLIQLIKTITAGNCFPVVNPSERWEVSPSSSSSSSDPWQLSSTLSVGACAAVRVSPVYESSECNSCSEPGGSFPPSLRLSTAFKSSNSSPLLTSHRHPSQWSLWETSSLSPPYLHPSIFHPLMTASFHSYSALSLRRLGGKHFKWPDALFNSSSTHSECKGV